MEVDNDSVEMENGEENIAVINKVNGMFESEQLKAKEKKRMRRDSSNRDKYSSNGNSVTNGNGGIANGTVNGSVGNGNGAIKIKPGKIGDRKSRSTYGRGLPKKNGGGGKGTWGKPGEVIDDNGVMDNHDPNYDSEEEDEVSFKSVVPEWTDEEITKTLEPIFLEYFEHGQKNEVIDLLNGVNMSKQKYLVFVVLITLSMEKKNEFRELTSQLIDDLVKPVPLIGPGVIKNNKNKFFATTTDLGDGILLLVKNMPELILDTPDADTVLGKFIARMIADKTIGASVLEDVKATALECENSNMAACEREAKILLSVPHYDFNRIWGVGGGNQPLAILKKKMTLLLKEYLSSGDSEEAIRCLTELDVPHFHHELIYEAIIMTIEVSSDRASNMMVYFIKRLNDSLVVDPEQLSQGLRRVYSNMPEISIDVPKAYHILESFVNKLHDLKVIGNRMKVEAPNKSRKRFVSEGDHGRYKNRDFFDLV